MAALSLAAMQALIDADITSNGAREITGAKLNGVLSALAQSGVNLVDGDIGGITSLASAATTDIGGAGSLRVLVTGSVTITSLGSVANRLRVVIFGGALTLTHNATSLVLPGGADIVTGAGDVAMLASDDVGNWRCLSYQRAAPLNTGPFSAEYDSGEQTITDGGTLTLPHGLGVEPKIVAARLICKTAQHGYAVGDRVNVASYINTNYSNTYGGVTIKDDAAEIRVVFPLNGILVHNYTTGVYAGITPANWRLRVWGYA